MPISDVETELTESLSRLETSLLTPVVSGELASWAQTCRAAGDAVAERYAKYLKDVLHRQYGEISRTDEELLRQVQQMRASDDNLAVDLAAFQRRLNSFADSAV